MAIMSLCVSGNAISTVMVVEMTGIVNGKAAPFLNTTPVHVGDRFGLTLSFDDSQQTTQQVSVNAGMLYTVVTQPFSPPITAWWGTLPEEIVRYNTPTADGSLTGWGMIQSWYRPATTFHHAEWRITSGGFSGVDGLRGFDLHIVTQFAGNLGYGWWAVGSPINSAERTIDKGFLSITSLSILPASSVPEPNTNILFAIGLAVIAGARLLSKKLATNA